MNEQKPNKAIMEKRTVSSILSSLKGLVEKRLPINKEIWLEAAFDLNLLRDDETKLLNKMRQEVAKKKLEILKSQTKKNVSLANTEIETLDEYRFMKDQEELIYSIDEFVRISKKNSDISY